MKNRFKNDLLGVAQPFIPSNLYSLSLIYIMFIMNIILIAWSPQVNCKIDLLNYLLRAFILMSVQHYDYVRSHNVRSNKVRYGKILIGFISTILSYASGL